MTALRPGSSWIAEYADPDLETNGAFLRRRCRVGPMSHTVCDIGRRNRFRLEFGVPRPLLPAAVISLSSQ